MAVWLAVLFQGLNGLKHEGELRQRAGRGCERDLDQFEREACHGLGAVKVERAHTASDEEDLGRVGVLPDPIPDHGGDERHRRYPKRRVVDTASAKDVSALDLLDEANGAVRQNVDSNQSGAHEQPSWW